LDRDAFLADLTAPTPEDLARDMVAAHGDGAVIVARENARKAAVSGRAEQAKFWLRIVGVIQRARPKHPSIEAEDDDERAD
jgi:hypothetical protein